MYIHIAGVCEKTLPGSPWGCSQKWLPQDQAVQWVSERGGVQIIIKRNNDNNNNNNNYDNNHDDIDIDKKNDDITVQTGL